MNDSSIAEVDFRGLLKHQLVERCKNNPRYSMRAFAKFLGIEASALSKILHGKRALTKTMLLKLGKRLGLDARSLNDFLAKEFLFDHEGGLKDNSQTFLQLQQDQFALASNWHYYAILELARTRSFKANDSHIASRLGISEWEARDAVERLMRLGLLDERYKPCEQGASSTTVGTKCDPALLINLQKQILQKSMDALTLIPAEERDQSTMIMAVSKKKLGDARQMIRKFRRELCAFLEDSEALDEVFHLSISLYPVTNSNFTLQRKKGGVSRDLKPN